MLRLEHLPISETRLVALGRGGGVLQSRARRLLRWNGGRLLFERFVLPGDSEAASAAQAALGTSENASTIAMSRESSFLGSSAPSEPERTD